ncbi:helix-turn-helix transcriptional regulator [Aliarcobacter butzleri]|uniref:helix-turn-helix domain-containing protein n=1 Tax=Aliarcobacter butzleri TaxID=28197 RepID=UPI001EDB0989|nr:helix-turn-helix transcriptional regulator [Aliarcobacter butzleri]MCG3667474.1 helix-turn-helix transcriptional regulator [Aliarcobacter butzleri]MDN5112925.1 helix-turn-helix transcriptional regulator [Aliarcobacter butzleri]
MSNLRLKEIREDNKLTQKEFAECINLKHEKIRDIENDKAKVTVEIAVAIEDKFNINLRWLLSGRGNKFINEEHSINLNNRDGNIAINGSNININKNDYSNFEDIKELLFLLKEAPKSWIPKINEKLKKSLNEIDEIF